MLFLLIELFCTVVRDEIEKKLVGIGVVVKCLLNTEAVEDGASRADAVFTYGQRSCALSAVHTQGSTDRECKRLGEVE